jgi:CheY-like chemotaxis protein
MDTGPKVLVVDDNNPLRILLSKMLSRLGYEVSSADSGENGLHIFLKNKFDLVFTDYEMPGIDGVAFACSIKEMLTPHTGRHHDGRGKGNRFIQKQHRGG